MKRVEEWLKRSLLERSIDIFFILAGLALIMAGECVPQIRYQNPISDGSQLKCPAGAVRLTDPRADFWSDCRIDERAWR